MQECNCIATFVRPCASCSHTLLQGPPGHPNTDVIVLLHRFGCSNRDLAMGKMKRTLLCAPPASDGDEESGREQQAPPAPYTRKNSTSKVNSAKALRATVPPGKSPVPAEKKTRTPMQTDSIAATDPSKSPKGKGTAAGKRKCTSEYASDSSSSGTTAPADSNGGRENSEMHVQSEENLDVSSGPSQQFQRAKKVEERSIVESACRKQLTSLKSENRRPLPPYVG